MLRKTLRFQGSFVGGGLFLLLALITPAYASTVHGTMTVYDNGAPATVPVHGTGDRRDCGRHSFTKDSGEVITVVIDCDRQRK